MEIVFWQDLQEFKGCFSQPLAMTIGVFDGVHKGHESLFRRILARKGEVPWVMTFKENPSRVLFPESYAGDLMTLEQKIHKIESYDIAGIVIIDFSQDFGKLLGAEFFGYVTKFFPLKYLAVGEDFHCGYRMDTNAEKVRTLLNPFGVQVEIAPPVFFRNAVVSSTRMRRLVLNGDFSSVEEMLGHPYTVDLSEVVPNTAKAGGVIAKKRISQVLPKGGTFQVFLQGPEGLKKATLEIDDDSIKWNHSGQVEAIVFTIRDEGENNVFEKGRHHQDCEGFRY